ncbi:MAG: hypothetical protein AAF928_02795 [Myxococcota bacterium]
MLTRTTVKWWLGLTALGAAAGLGACGSDVENTDGPATSATSTSTTSSAGGAGGAGGTDATSTTSSTTGGGGAGNVCEQACAQVDACSPIPGACDIVGDLGFVDINSCDDAETECAAECIRTAQCGALLSLVSPPTDPALEGCLLACFPPCNGCLITNCGQQLQACGNDTGGCADYLTCFEGCPENDFACYDACAATHPSAGTDAVVACGDVNCDAECNGGAGGAGGQAAGGAGGGS